MTSSQPTVKQESQLSRTTSTREVNRNQIKLNNQLSTSRHLIYRYSIVKLKKESGGHGCLVKVIWWKTDNVVNFAKMLD